MQIDYGYSSGSRIAEDRLVRMFELREKFMVAIREKRGAYGQWPVNIGEKKSQQTIREITLKGVEEMFEALGELKNWKSHRVTENPEVDQDAFLEEMVDAFNYFFAAMILVGITPEKFYNAYVEKDRVIHERLNNGY